MSESIGQFCDQPRTTLHCIDRRQGAEGEWRGSLENSQWCHIALGVAAYDEGARNDAAHQMVRSTVLGIES